jgi:hypothetical protein
MTYGGVTMSTRRESDIDEVCVGEQKRVGDVSDVMLFACTFLRFGVLALFFFSCLISLLSFAWSSIESTLALRFSLFLVLGRCIVTITLIDLRKSRPYKTVSTRV